MTVFAEGIVPRTCESSSVHLQEKTYCDCEVSYFVCAIQTYSADPSNADCSNPSQAFSL